MDNRIFKIKYIITINNSLQKSSTINIGENTVIPEHG